MYPENPEASTNIGYDILCMALRLLLIMLESSLNETREMAASLRDKCQFFSYYYTDYVGQTEFTYALTFKQRRLLL